MKEKRTKIAIAAFYHAAGLKKTPDFPAWVMDAALGGKEKKSKEKKSDELISVLDLFGNGSKAPVDEAPNEKELKPPFDGYPEDELHLESLLLWGKENLDSLPSDDAYVSRYEAGRLAAALACIQPDTADQASAQPMRLLAGDLSGVQDFIYTITNKGAVSALRGRSLYLQLLTEAIARYALDILELPISNLLYMGGGQFHILAPKTDNLDELRQKISKKLLNHHKGALSLTLGEVTLQEDELSGEKVAQKRKELNEDLQERKKRKFSELGKEGLRELFAPQGHGGNEDAQCSVCGMEDDEVEAIEDDDGNETGSYICPACDSYQELGKGLRQAWYLVLRETSLKESDRGYKRTLHHFGWDAQFYEKGELPGDSGEKEIVLAISEDALEKLTPSETRAVGRRYLVNVTPLATGDEKYEPEKGEKRPQKNDIKPFKMLAEEAEGINRLGVLRMDVDDLGKLFESGLGENASLARLNALSGQISKFFEGEVERIAKEVDANRLYSIYSGGDDLFFVGAWDAVLELAVTIREKLDQFTGNNPEIHASAGIVLISNKYPLAQGAQAAGVAEEKAKSLKWWDGAEERSKDAVTFLGETLPWQKFSGSGDTSYAIMQQLHQMLHDEKAARGPIYNLLRFYEQYQDALKKRQEKEGERQTKDEKPQALWGRWMWLGYYYLTKKNAPKGLHKIAEELKDTEFRAMEKVGVATRWAMLLNRKNSAKKNEGGL